MTLASLSWQLVLLWLGGVLTGAGAAMAFNARSRPSSAAHPDLAQDEALQTLEEVQELEALRARGLDILESVCPTRKIGTAGAVRRDIQARPDVLAEDKQLVARWTRDAGLVVEREFPQFVLFFYGDDDQPIPLEPETTREQLDAHMHARLTRLGEIIRAVLCGDARRHPVRERMS